MVIPLLRRIQVLPLGEDCQVLLGVGDARLSGGADTFAFREAWRTPLYSSCAFGLDHPIIIRPQPDF